MGEADDADDEVIAELREKAARLETLETQLRALEQEREDLLDSKQRMSSELDQYQKRLTEWEWFFEHSVQMLCIAGLDGYFKRVNAAFADTLGYSKEELLSRPILDFVHPDDTAKTIRELEGLGVGRNSISFENHYRAGDGSWRRIAWHCPAVTDVTTKLFAVARDVTEDRRKEEAILYKASHDSLTGLHNRAAFEESLERAIAQQRRTRKGEVVLYLVDLDGFKAVNDQYGHMAGDHLLQVISERLRTIQRAADMVARVGGDEFVFLADGDTEATGICPYKPLAERIIGQVSEPIELNDGIVTVNCSVGISTLPGTADDASSLMVQADQAMYATKRSGKNGFRKFDPSLTR
ncbi:PAS domain S-box-containing protein/diguanylate cyclase (GGDEF)-like protein [Tamilnaduibacter salinus]|uniref:PAS domain S-box-containing protein/diguanylate cyclase (GGDEF)-like protein n=2 Tax=Tamilnaduibacter salinus TaxID=1484056 RepID=A0A2U1CTP5_9GAMM|nr:PAS domain S-box-containing protein/diguanylate cyclase (GGDEF)-like protein [Tamilnaduibacter salinus]